MAGRVAGQGGSWCCGDNRFHHLFNEQRAGIMEERRDDEMREDVRGSEVVLSGGGGCRGNGWSRERCSISKCPTANVGTDQEGKGRRIGKIDVNRGKLN